MKANSARSKATVTAHDRSHSHSPCLQTAPWLRPECEANSAARWLGGRRAEKKQATPPTKQRRMKRKQADRDTPHSTHRFPNTAQRPKPRATPAQPTPMRRRARHCWHCQHSRWHSNSGPRCTCCRVRAAGQTAPHTPPAAVRYWRKGRDSARRRRRRWRRSHRRD